MDVNVVIVHMETFALYISHVAFNAVLSQLTVMKGFVFENLGRGDSYRVTAPPRLILALFTEKGVKMPMSFNPFTHTVRFYFHKTLIYISKHHEWVGVASYFSENVLSRRASVMLA